MASEKKRKPNEDNLHIQAEIRKNSRIRSKGAPRNAFGVISQREQNGAFTAADKVSILQHRIPKLTREQHPEVERLDSRAYGGQFSSDGTRFVAYFQDRTIRVYDTTDVTLRSMPVCAEVFAKHLRWTITDTDLDPSNQMLLYSSITSMVHLVNVRSGAVQQHDTLDFALQSGPSDFGIWSLKFSQDSSEIVAGASDSAIYVFNIQLRKPTLRIQAHDDDVNSVAWCDPTSNLIFSASDDALCKVWDRRSLGASCTAAGVFVGHTEGLTHVSSKSDARYLITNSKDQTLKLWDLRKMRNSSEYASLKNKYTSPYSWDYRWMPYPGKPGKVKHPKDQSIMTFTGHQVLQTLIRAYFSPAYSTANRYIYTGSSDAACYIYDILGDGTPLRKLGHSQSLVSRDPVRDVSWHPYEPLLISSAWDGRLVASYGPDPPEHTPTRVFSRCTRHRQHGEHLQLMHIPAAYINDDDDNDDDDEEA